jgi:hypothetical protein
MLIRRAETLRGPRGRQRVTMKASHRNGPSQLRRQTSPKSLHSSQGIWGSSDCISMERPRSGYPQIIFRIRVGTPVQTASDPVGAVRR